MTYIVPTSADAVIAQRVDPWSEAETVQHEGLPGEVRMYAGTSEPTGWLFCDGRAVSRTEYASLFTIVGTAYGAGDGSTTFNLPDLGGMTPVGVKPSDLDFHAAGHTGGAKTHQLTSSEMPAHTHVQDAHTHTQNAHTHPFTNYGSGVYNLGAGGMGITALSGTAAQTTSASTATNQSTVATNQSTGSDGAHNNLQPYLCLNFIICT